MSRTVRCAKNNMDLMGLDKAPYPGEMGQRIYDNISKQAWEEWQAYQTILINENRLTPFKAEDKAFILKEMEKFLFENTV